MKDILYKQDYNLDDLIPSFKSRGINLELKRMQSAIYKMGNPCKKIPAIQISGTNYLSL